MCPAKHRLSTASTCNVADLPFLYHLWIFMTLDAYEVACRNQHLWARRPWRRPHWQLHPFPIWSLTLSIRSVFPCSLSFFFWAFSQAPFFSASGQRYGWWEIQKATSIGFKAKTLGTTPFFWFANQSFDDIWCSFFLIPSINFMVWFDECSLWNWWSLPYRSYVAYHRACHHHRAERSKRSQKWMVQNGT